MIKQAYVRDIPVVEEILLDAVKWMSKIGLQNQRKRVKFKVV